MSHTPTATHCSSGPRLWLWLGFEALTKRTRVENPPPQEAFRELLSSAEYPARDPDTNLADIRAQIASNNKGIGELRKMVGYYGLATVQAYMQHVQDNAEEAVRRAITAFRSGTCEVRAVFERSVKRGVGVKRLCVCVCVCE